MTRVNLVGYVEHPVFGETPYRVSQDGDSYVPVGDGGIVLGLELGDSVFRLAADHAAPGACLTHPDAAARHALATYACIGNKAVVRTGPAAGTVGTVLGKRGEEGRVIVCFPPAELAAMRPGDDVLVHTSGQGQRPASLPPDVALLNLDPDVLARLPVDITDGEVTAGVRVVVAGKLAGNGIGRPAVSWDLDLQLGPAETGTDMLLGDLVAVTDIDARYNMGYRRGWVTVGVIGHGASPLPGHGPGLTPILTGPATALQPTPDAAGHVGLTASFMQLQ